MKSIKEIEENFRSIARSNNLSGDSVELLIKLLSYNQYEAALSTRIALLEALPSRAVNENSKIEHAINEMYSIYRGKNSKLTVEVKVTGNKSLRRFDRVYSDKNNTFFYSHLITSSGEEVFGDIDLLYGRTYKLVLIKAEEVITSTLSVDINNTYLLESLSENISEDYSLRDSSDRSIDLPTTKNFAEHLDGGTESGDGIYFDLTMPGYGLRFYSPDSLGFSSSLTYILKYIPFIENSIDESTLRTLRIDGVEILDYDSFIIDSFVPRESLNNFLYNLSKNTVLQSRVRSNEDLSDQFRSLFASQIKDCKQGNYDLQTDILTLDYIPLNSNSPKGVPSQFEVSEEDKNEKYLPSLMYYVTKNIELNPLYDYLDAKNLYITLTVIIKSQIDISEISNYLSEIEFKIDAEFNIDKFRGFVNTLDGAVYSELRVQDSMGNELTGIQKAGESKYFKILEHFNYSYKLTYE